MYPCSSQMFLIFLIDSSFSDIKIILCFVETPVRISNFSIKFDRNVDFPIY